MTLVQLLNQTMPEGSYWESLIYSAEGDFNLCESVAKVQYLLGKLTGVYRRPSAQEIRNRFKHKFTG
ncbi:hypothetical protein Erwinia_phage_Pastis_00077 [Erwinia phage Pastis]|nr:hypothetical protein Erwinia_phage_Pastis_00077 [Erwinia phage Pastis]